MPANRVIIIANPYSGSIDNRPRVDELVDLLHERNLTTQVLWDHDERHAQLTDPTTLDGCRCIVAAGGDGTVSDVVNLRLDLPLATLPLGTENLYAKALNHASVPILADAIAAGNTRHIDLMTVNDRWVGLMTSVGFDAEVTRRRDTWRANSAPHQHVDPRHHRPLRRGGRLSFMPFIAQCLAAYDFPLITLHADDHPPVTGTFALVSNLPQYGLGFNPNPHARADDGELDWLVFTGAGPISLLSFMYSGQRGRLQQRRDVICGTGKQIHIESAPENFPGAGAAQADGDAIGFTPLKISVQPSALEVITP